MRSSRSRVDRRKPLGTRAASRPRAVRGRTGAEETPLTIRTRDVPISDALRAHMHTRAGFRLAPFARSIERVSVRFDRIRRIGESSPAVRCRIKVVVTRLQSVVAEATAPTARQAFGDAISAGGRWLKHLQKRRIRQRRKPGMQQLE